MMNQVRSRVSAGSIVLAGSLSRGSTECRERRIGQNEIHDSCRQIFGPTLDSSSPSTASSSENNLSKSQQIYDTTTINNGGGGGGSLVCESFIQSSKFINMIEDIAKNKTVQDIIFTGIPLSENEIKKSSKKKIKEDKHFFQKKTIRGACEEEDLSSVNNVMNTNASHNKNDNHEIETELKELKDELEDKDELNSNLLYHNEQLQDLIEKLITLLQSLGVNTRDIMDQHHNKYKKTPHFKEDDDDEGIINQTSSLMINPKQNSLNLSQSHHVHNNDSNDNENVESNDNDEVVDDVSFESLLRGAVVTAAVYVVTLCIYRRTPGKRKVAQQIAQSASVIIRNSITNAFAVGNQ
mmetsp:Transcript_14626/g.17414  ORF Transcript_14626/g.17414 Transcript_14626/m.17414 type:complete len:352 (+) Transcript_14626:160-1215(+)